jgi:hypothetical protein
MSEDTTLAPVGTLTSQGRATLDLPLAIGPLMTINVFILAGFVASGKTTAVVREGALA